MGEEETGWSALDKISQAGNFKKKRKKRKKRKIKPTSVLHQYKPTYCPSPLQDIYRK